MEILIWGALLGLITGAIANSKGKSFGLWWFYGFMIFIVALPHSLLMKPTDTHLIKNGGMRKCRKCAELIKEEASVCKYCGDQLVVGS